MEREKVRDVTRRNGGWEVTRKKCHLRNLRWVMAGVIGNLMMVFSFG